jgi:hypothetical protein
MDWKPILPFDYNKEIERLLDLGYRSDYVHELLEILMKKHNIQVPDQEQ